MMQRLFYEKILIDFFLSFFSDVIRANYGRFSITICNQHGNTDWKVDCQAGRTLRAMQARCSNKNQCIVPVQSSIFGDPCPGTYKYIEVHYACRKGTFIRCVKYLQISRSVRLGWVGLRAMQARCSNKNQCTVPVQSSKILASHTQLLTNRLRFTMHVEKVH